MSDYGTAPPSADAQKARRFAFRPAIGGRISHNSVGTPFGTVKHPGEISLSAAPNSLLLGMPWLMRRAWVVVVTTLLVALVAVGLTHGRQPTYSANAILLVSPGASATSPGSAAEAQGLAVTYSGLIPNDSALLAAVGSAMGLTNSEVQHDLSVTVVSGTSLLDVQFTEKSPARAITGARAIANAIAGTPPVTKAIPNGTVNITSPPTTANRHATKSLLILLVGLVLGFLLGVVVMIVWEQADARFDRPGQITGALRIPARSLRGMSEVSASSLVERWREISRRHPARIAMVAGVPGMTGAVIELSRQLSIVNSHTAAANVTIDSRITESNAPVLEVHSVDVVTPDWEGGKLGEYLDTVISGDGVVLLPSGAPGTEGGEAVAQHADLAVLVIPRGARAREIRETFVLLRQVGVRPKWALLVDTKMNRYRPNKESDDENLNSDRGAGLESVTASTSSEIVE